MNVPGKHEIDQRHPYNLQDVMEYFECRYIRNILEVTGWDLNETARLLDIPQTTLHTKIKKYALQRPSSASSRIGEKS